MIKYSPWKKASGGKINILEIWKTSFHSTKDDLFYFMFLRY